MVLYGMEKNSDPNNSAAQGRTRQNRAAQGEPMRRTRLAQGKNIAKGLCKPPAAQDKCLSHQGNGARQISPHKAMP